MSGSDASYTDEKGRVRWPENDRVAALLKELYDLLVIGGYEESHAVRYNKLAYLISRHPEPISRLRETGRLRELPGVAATVETILAELIDTGTCAKMTDPNPEWGYTPPPRTVLELTALPGVGAKTARRLYAEYDIDSTNALRAARAAYPTIKLPGVGPKAWATVLHGAG